MWIPVYYEDSLWKCADYIGWEVVIELETGVIYIEFENSVNLFSVDYK